MTKLIDSFRLAEAPLRSVIEDVPAERWSSPSPCDGWAAVDVLRHLIESQHDFLSGKGVDLPAPASIDDDPAGAWKSHSAAFEAVVSDDEAMAIAYDGHFGPTTVGDTVRDIFVFDMVAHRWDIATAAGMETQFTEAELDQMEAGMSTFGDALYMPGVAKAGVEAPDGASRQQIVLARLGRAA